MTLFNDNIARLAARDTSLAAAVKTSAGGVLTIEPARSGVPSARRAGRWIHSAYDPIREAETWAETHTPVCREGETVVVAGVGLLYHVEALRKRVASEIVDAVLISDLDEFHDALVARPLESWAENILWLSGTPVEIADRLSKTGRPLRCLSYAPAMHSDANFHGTFEQALRRAFRIS